MNATRGVLSIVVVMILAACGSSAAPSSSSVAVASPTTTVSSAESPGMTAGPEPTLLPTGQPTREPAETAEPVRWEWAQDPPEPLLMGTAVRVAVDELNVRARPTTSARRVGTVPRGSILVVDGAPVESDGIVWYRGRIVSASGDLPALPKPILSSGEPISGWFAAFNGETPYVALVDPRCPNVIDSRNVTAMLPAERLACFGDRSIVIEGTIGCEPCTTHIFGEFTPEWLNNPNAVDNLLWEGWMEGANLMLRFPPAGPNPPDAGRIIRVRGHFGDSASADCSLSEAYPWADGFTFEPVGPSVARQLCRQELVIEQVEILGTDPGFESGGG